MTAAWPGASAVTSSPKKGTERYWPPDFPNWKRGSFLPSRVITTKTRPSTASLRTEAGYEISKRNGAAPATAEQNKEIETKRRMILELRTRPPHVFPFLSRAA